MIQVDSVEALRQTTAPWKGELAFVPTMGNLHEGHITLVREAKRLAQRVVVSIFVNPMQFGGGEDFGSYPRTLARDAEMLEAAGCDLLFAPPVEVVYPKPMELHTQVEVPGISDVLCGASRPGHFAGVATVVCKLFNMVQPDIAVFGKKDFQQLMVIRRMVEDLCLPVRIHGVDTVREADGLAMSSRNGYLTDEERIRAAGLNRALRGLAQQLRDGRTDYTALEMEAAAELERSGFRSDYVAIRRGADLELPTAGERSLVVLAAAYLGKARLIDNCEVVL